MPVTTGVSLGPEYRWIRACGAAEQTARTGRHAGRRPVAESDPVSTQCGPDRNTSGPLPALQQNRTGSPSAPAAPHRCRAGALQHAQRASVPDTKVRHDFRPNCRISQAESFRAATPVAVHHDVEPTRRALGGSHGPFSSRRVIRMPIAFCTSSVITMISAARGRSHTEIATRLIGSAVTKPRRS